MCVNPVAIIFVCTGFSITVTSLASLIFYFEFGPLTFAHASGYSAVCLANGAFLAATLLAFFVLNRKSYRILYITLVELGFACALIYGVLSLRAFQVSPTRTQLYDYFMHHVEQYGREPAYLHYLQVSDKGCCGILGPIDYIHSNPSLTSFVDNSVEVDWRDGISLIPPSCCRHKDSNGNCHAHISQGPQGSASTFQVDPEALKEILRPFIYTRGCLQSGLEGLGDSIVNVQRYLLAQFSYLGPVFSGLNLLYFNLHLFKAVTGKSLPFFRKSNKSN